MKNIVSEIYFILLGMVLFAVASCRHSSPADSLLASADAVMHTRPDSALMLLQQVQHPEKLQGEQQALYALLSTQASYKNGIPVESDSLISIACDYYSASPDSVRKAWSCFYAAQVYRDMSMPQKALEYFHMADNASRGSDDNRFLKLLYFHWGGMLDELKLYEESIWLQKKAISISAADKDTSSLIFDYSQLGWTYILKEDIDSAEWSLGNGIRLLDAYGMCEPAINLYQRMSIVKHMQKKYDDAIEYINKSISLDGSKTIPLLFTKGDIFFDMNMLDSATYYYSFLKEDSCFSKMEKNAYFDFWANFYEDINDYKTAYTYLKERCRLTDELAEDNTSEEIARIQKRYDYTVIKHENDRLKLQRMQSTVWLVVLCGSLLVAVAVAYIIYLSYIRYRRNRDEMLRSRDELLRQLRLELREKSLALERVESGPTVAGDSSADSLRAENESLRSAMLRTSDVMRRVESLQNGGTGSLTSAEMSDLADTLDVCFDGFCRRLKSDFPSLNASDLAYCCLVRLGVPSYSILHLLDVSKETLKRRKTRMKHDKMHLPDGVSLDEYIKNRK